MGANDSTLHLAHNAYYLAHRLTITCPAQVNVSLALTHPGLFICWLVESGMLGADKTLQYAGQGVLQDQSQEPVIKYCTVEKPCIKYNGSH